MKLEVEKKIYTSQKSCYDAFTEASHLSKWFTTNAKSDVRVGGRYSNDDKDEGKYLELIPYRLIRFTWENKDHCPGTEVKVEFISQDENNTKVVLSHSKLKDEDHVKDMTKGWTWALESLRLYIETGKPITYGEWEKTYY